MKTTAHGKQAARLRMLIRCWADEKYPTGGCGVYADGEVNVYVNYDSDYGVWQADIYIPIDRFSGLSDEEVIVLVETETGNSPGV